MAVYIRCKDIDKDEEKGRTNDYLVSVSKIRFKEFIWREEISWNLKIRV